jgi:hypothetical protein
MMQKEEEIKEGERRIWRTGGEDENSQVTEVRN